MLRLQNVQVMTVVVPFRMTFRHALASRSEGESVVVRVADDEGRVGFGEAVPRSYVTGETLETVRQTLGQVLVPPLLGVCFSSFDEITAALKHCLSQCREISTRPSARWNSAFWIWRERSSVAPRDPWPEK
jgi:L-alanine-DL-glutamate epimerase-like enolase superfamily enzyme